MVIILETIMTYIIPAGEFERVKIAVGVATRVGVKPGTLIFPVSSK